ncbi:MAG: 4Fe-4S binding protein [Planctomycetes bacterium]|nr:4Fe-4S binding protein [Planctomycetota bacterium]
MPLGKTRDKVITGLARASGRLHRYTRVRIAVAVVFTLAIAALPAFDVLRLDLWGGHHHYLGQQQGLVETAKRFAFPFLGINLAILLASRFFGRYLCGFVCPQGSVARLGEWLRFRAKTRRDRLVGVATMVSICAVLSVVSFSFWVDWRVFRDGGALSIALSALSLLAMVAGFYFLAQRVGLGFCRHWCPSGVYFALLGHETCNGIEFAHPRGCTDCGACDKACPMDLKPRAMSLGAYRPGDGFYPDGLSNFSLCIRCGDCVSVCERVHARGEEPTALRMGPLPEHARGGAASEHAEAPR